MLRLVTDLNADNAGPRPEQRTGRVPAPPSPPCA